MTKYRLKKGQENFTPMSGTFEGRKFLKGVIYTEIPKEETHRFDKVPEKKPAADPEKKTTKPATKPDAGGGE